jgi:integrase
LRAGRLHFECWQTKTRTERAVPLPAELFAALNAIKGETYLWERYTEDAKRFRRGTRNRDTFDPKTLYWAVSNIFREYNAAHPTAKVKPHDLRKRAITLTTLATKSVDATAQAIGVGAQTARRYYVDAQAAFDTDAVFEKMANVLDIARPSA